MESKSDIAAFFPVSLTQGQKDCEDQIADNNNKRRRAAKTLVQMSTDECFDGAALEELACQLVHGEQAAATISGMNKEFVEPPTSADQQSLLDFANNCTMDVHAKHMVTNCTGSTQALQAAVDTTSPVVIRFFQQTDLDKVTQQLQERHSRELRAANEAHSHAMQESLHLQHDKLKKRTIVMCKKIQDDADTATKGVRQALADQSKTLGECQQTILTLEAKLAKLLIGASPHAKTIALDLDECTGSWAMGSIFYKIYLANCGREPDVRFFVEHYLKAGAARPGLCTFLKGLSGLVKTNQNTRVVIFTAASNENGWVDFLVRCITTFADTQYLITEVFHRDDCTFTIFDGKAGYAKNLSIVSPKADHVLLIDDKPKKALNGLAHGVPEFHFCISKEHIDAILADVERSRRTTAHTHQEIRTAIEADVKLTESEIVTYETEDDGVLSNALEICAKFVQGRLSK